MRRPRRRARPCATHACHGRSTLRRRGPAHHRDRSRPPCRPPPRSASRSPARFRGRRPSRGRRAPGPGRSCRQRKAEQLARLGRCRGPTVERFARIDDLADEFGVARGKPRAGRSWMLSSSPVRTWPPSARHQLLHLRTGSARCPPPPRSRRASRRRVPSAGMSSRMPDAPAARSRCPCTNCTCGGPVHQPFLDQPRGAVEHATGRRPRSPACTPNSLHLAGEVRRPGRAGSHRRWSGS